MAPSRAAQQAAAEQRALTTMDRWLNVRNFAVVWITTITGIAGFALTTAARWSNLPEKTDSNTARIEHLEESGRYQGCVLRSIAEHRDPEPCRYYLPTPNAYQPPSESVRP